MKAVIFGANGQDGYYLSALLEQLGYTVIKAGKNNGPALLDYKNLCLFIEKEKPAYVFHFAANSTTQHYALFENHESISTGTLNILESVRLHSPASKVFLSGSAMQFKNEGKPIDESTPFEASSPYSVARIQSVYAARYYRHKFAMKIYAGYFFNHDSPLRTEKHVNQKIVKSVQRIVQGSNEMLTLGNIGVKKEFNYAGDVVEAVWQLMNQDDIFETVIGCGKAYSIEEWLAYCFSRHNLDWKNYVVLEKGFIPEYEILVSNPRLIKSLGWTPKVDFYQLANMMMGE